MTRILVADDQPLVRVGLAKILETRPDFAVVGEAGDGVEAVEQSARLRPDVVVMDIRMPRMDGLEATRQIAELDANRPRVLVLTTFGHNEYVYAALRAGASGFLLKDAPAEELRGIRPSPTSERPAGGENRAAHHARDRGAGARRRRPREQ